MSYADWLKNFTDYKPITNFWNDFSIAEQIGEDEVKGTFDRLFKEWKDNFKYLTELVMVLNHKMFQHSEIPYHKRLCELYESLWEKADQYGLEHLEGTQLQYFLETLD